MTATLGYVYDHEHCLASSSKSAKRDGARWAPAARRRVSGYSRSATGSRRYAIVTCNDSRSRLPVIPAADLPTVLALDFETGSAEISGHACLQLLEPLAAVSTERARFYLCGIFLHTVGDDLVAVATDGVRLVRVAVPAAAFSASHDLILPSEAATVLRRLLRTKPDVVRLRRSKRLLAVTAPDFAFCTRLIDGTFPIYEPEIPPASRNAVTCSRSELLAAMHRLSAVCNAEPPQLVALSWRSEGRRCVIARQPDDGSDTINAQATGAARIAVPLRQIVGLIGNFDCESLRLEAGAEGLLMIIGEAKRADHARHLEFRTGSSVMTGAQPPIGKIAELLRATCEAVKSCVPGRPATINRISWHPIPVDAP